MSAVGAAFDQVHLDAGLFLEQAVELQVDIVMAVRVDVYLTLSRRLRGRGRSRPHHHGRCQKQPPHAIRHGIILH